MKKLLMIVFLFLGFQATTSLNADMRYDTTSGLIYTLPATPDIDLNAYRNLHSQTAVMTIFAMNAGKLGTAINVEADAYLVSIGTPTALRLLSDLKKLR